MDWLSRLRRKPDALQQGVGSIACAAIRHFPRELVALRVALSAICSASAACSRRSSLVATLPITIPLQSPSCCYLLNSDGRNCYCPRRGIEPDKIVLLLGQC